MDQHGGELMGSRIHGNPDCGKHKHIRARTHAYTHTEDNAPSVATGLGA